MSPWQLGSFLCVQPPPPPFVISRCNSSFIAWHLYFLMKKKQRTCLEITCDEILTHTRTKVTLTLQDLVLNLDLMHRLDFYGLAVHIISLIWPGCDQHRAPSREILKVLLSSMFRITEELPPAQHCDKGDFRVMSRKHGFDQIGNWERPIPCDLCCLHSHENSTESHVSKLILKSTHLMGTGLQGSDLSSLLLSLMNFH